MANGSLGIFHLTVCRIYIVIAWSCALVRLQPSKAEPACHRCPSYMPVTEMNMTMSTYQIHYNGADTEDAENS